MNKRLLLIKDSDPDHLRWAYQLINYRTANKLTQAEVARRAGYEQSLICKFEHCRPPITPAIQDKIARGLGVKVSDIWPSNEKDHNA
jgi:transcriptional regulator with XRE-family HTH domain